jgi:hypothetical protein
MRERAVDAITLHSETGSTSGYVRRDTSQRGYVAGRWLWECGWCDTTGQEPNAAEAVRVLVQHHAGTDESGEGCEGEE